MENTAFRVSVCTLETECALSPCSVCFTAERLEKIKEHIWHISIPKLPNPHGYPQFSYKGFRVEELLHVSQNGQALNAPYNMIQFMTACDFMCYLRIVRLMKEIGKENYGASNKAHESSSAR